MLYIYSTAALPVSSSDLTDYYIDRSDVRYFAWSFFGGHFDVSCCHLLHLALLYGYYNSKTFCDKHKDDTKYILSLMDGHNTNSNKRLSRAAQRHLEAWKRKEPFLIALICCCVSHLNCNWWCWMLRVGPVSLSIYIAICEWYLTEKLTQCQAPQLTWLWLLLLREWHLLRFPWRVLLLVDVIKNGLFLSACVVKTSLGARIKIMAFPLQIHQYLKEQFCHEPRRVNYICSVIWYCSSRALRNKFYFFFPSTSENQPLCSVE